MNLLARELIQKMDELHEKIKVVRKIRISNVKFAPNLCMEKELREYFSVLMLIDMKIKKKNDKTI